MEIACLVLLDNARVAEESERARLRKRIRLVEGVNEIGRKEIGTRNSRCSRHQMDIVCTKDKVVATLIGANAARAKGAVMKKGEEVVLEEGDVVEFLCDLYEYRLVFGEQQSGQSASVGSAESSSMMDKTTVSSSGFQSLEMDQLIMDGVEALKSDANVVDELFEMEEVEEVEVEERVDAMEENVVEEVVERGGKVTVLLQSLGTGAMMLDPLEAIVILVHEAKAFFQQLPAEHFPDLSVVLCEEDESIAEMFQRQTQGVDKRFSVAKGNLLQNDSTLVWSTPVEGNVICFGVNWRWKPADPRVFRALGQEFFASVRGSATSTTQLCNVYPVQIPTNTPMARNFAGNSPTFAMICVPPNGGNPNKPDFVSDISTVRTLLGVTYRRLFSEIANYAMSN